MAARKERPEARIGVALRSKGLRLATAESCTGGLFSGAITSVPGSSDYYTGGVVAYSNEVKECVLGVRGATLKKYGAVSAGTARELAEGVRKLLGSDIGVSITGIAGPGGGSPEKPVGTVYIGVAFKKRIIVRKYMFKGTRREIRTRSVEAALRCLASVIGLK